MECKDEVLYEACEDELLYVECEDELFYEVLYVQCGSQMQDCRLEALSIDEVKKWGGGREFIGFGHGGDESKHEMQT